ncbi:MAG TPA: WhiB family transcriptional regulator [Acidimicrobiia bacterium]
MSGLGWKEDAACASDPGLHWFGTAIPSMVSTCDRCPVLEDCLWEALERDWRVDVGFWGGTDEYQRRAIRKGSMTAAEARAANREAITEGSW